MKNFNFNFVLGFKIYVLGFCLAYFAMSGDPREIIDPLSLVFFGIPLLGILIATKSLKIFGVSFKAVLFPNSPLSKDMQCQALSLFRMLSKATIIVTIIGVIVPFICIMINMNFEDIAAMYFFRLNIATILVFPVYGLIIIGGLFEPIVFNLKKRSEIEPWRD